MPRSEGVFVMVRKGREYGSSPGPPGRPEPRRPGNPAPHTTRSPQPARPSRGSPPWALHRAGDPFRRGSPGVDDGSGCEPPPSRLSGGSHRRPSYRHPARLQSHNGPGGADPVGPSAPPDAGVGSRRGVGVGQSSRQAGPALLPPRSNDGPACTGLHPLAEAVLAGPLPGVWLVRTLHRSTPLGHPGVIRRGSARGAVDFMGSRRPVRSRSFEAMLIGHRLLRRWGRRRRRPGAPPITTMVWASTDGTWPSGYGRCGGRANRRRRPPSRIARTRSSASELSTVSTGSPLVSEAIHLVSRSIPTTGPPCARSARKQG